MGPADVDALLELSENEHLEFKKATRTFRVEDVYEYVAALANELGGRLILGVTNAHPRQVVGSLAFVGEIEQLKQRILQKVQIRVEIAEVAHPRGRVLVFDVPSRPPGRPIHLDGRYLMRSGESVVPMTLDQIQVITAETGPDFSAEICPSATWDDLDSEHIEEFRRRWMRKSGTPNLAGASVFQLLADAELVVGNQVTYAALVLFGKRTSLGKLLGQAEVVFEYRASNATGPAQQRVEFRQGFLGFYDELWDLIELRNTVQHYRDGLFIWDIKTFNESAIREAVLNAISHRDYRSGASIFVRQYPERIEIASPGGPPDGVTLDNILWQQNPRNRRLADAFARCGLVERAGQGMNRIFEACIRESKGDPDFHNTDTKNFWLTLHGTIQHPEFLRVLEKIGEDRLRSFSTEDFIIIQAVYTNRPLPEQHQRAAERLLEDGLLERAPGAKSKFILSRRLYAAIGKKGVHTKKAGLDRDTNKALLVKHIRRSEPEGARLEEMKQVLPFLDRGPIQVLLRELREAGEVHHHGNTRAGKWYSGPAREGCHHEEQ